MTRLPRPSVPRTLGPALGLLFALSLAGCSTFQAWFTPEGQALSRAQAAAQDGHPLAASAQAAQALDLEPTYAEARQALLKWFAPGQEEFRSQTDLWRASSDPFRWDRLYELYGWQQTLATLGPRLPPLVDPQSGLALNVAVPPVAQDRAEAGRRAAEAHLERAQALLQALPGPRQARQALAEGRRASSFDPDAPGLAPWLSQAEAAAAQRLLVFPFFLQAPGRFGNPSAALGSELSRRLLDSDRRPEQTTVGATHNLATPHPKQVADRLADALALAAAGCFSLVLECVPRSLGRDITAALAAAGTPLATIGIGAGPETSGQVLVFHDLLNLVEGRKAKFVPTRYPQVGRVITEALGAWNADVRGGVYPSDAESYH